MSNSDSDDDELDNLFSFSASSTPVADAPARKGSVDSDLDLDLDDVVRATPARKSTDASQDDDAEIDEIFGPSKVTTDSSRPIERKDSSGGDSFLDILGEDAEEEDNGDSKEKVADLYKEKIQEDDFLDIMGEDASDDDKGDDVPNDDVDDVDDAPKPVAREDSFLEVSNADASSDKEKDTSDGDPAGSSSSSESAVLVERPPLSAAAHDEDAFHKHDSGTRDFLEWLDNGEGGAGGGVVPEEEEAPGDAGGFDFAKDILGEESAAVTSLPDDPEAAAPMEKEETPDSQFVDAAPTIAELPPPKQQPVPPPPPPPKPVRTFVDLAEAVHSSEATVDNVRALFRDRLSPLDPELRPALWVKVMCDGRTLEEVSASSVADSFRDWRATSFDRELSDHPDHAALHETADALTASVADEEERATARLSLLASLVRRQRTRDAATARVVRLVTAAGVPDAAADVLTTRLLPAAAPLLVLEDEERRRAARSLHGRFYRLACYHAPLLVTHLDKHVPGWYWPKKNKGAETTEEEEEEENVTRQARALDARGLVPESWFVSLFAGDHEVAERADDTVTLWDTLLVDGDHSLKFFLALAVLERRADDLLMARNAEKLRAELATTLELSDVLSDSEAYLARARLLSDSTPRSVAAQLAVVEDEAVEYAVAQRQRATEERLKAALEEEADAHRRAAEEERQRQIHDTERALVRTQLINFYTKYNPDKIDTVDAIMERFDGRLYQLDGKLRDKYGKGFGLQLSARTTKFVATVNRGISEGVTTTRTKTKALLTRRTTDERLDHLMNVQEPHAGRGVAVEVDPAEVLPVVCKSRCATASPDDHDVPLRFYLVDARPACVAAAQGRLPTAVPVDPEAVLDPERVQRELEVFESLRGTVHVCVLGEGLSSLPELYSHELSAHERAVADEDAARTDACALLFLKRGFPYVSTLRGGFAGAHAWLVRRGPEFGVSLHAALVDYDPHVSLLARMERAHAERCGGGPSTKDRATRAVTNVLDASLTRLTRSANKIDELVENAAEAKERRMESVKSMRIFQKKSRDGEEDEVDRSAVVDIPLTTSTTMRNPLDKIEFKNPLEKVSSIRGVFQKKGDGGLDGEEIKDGEERTARPAFGMNMFQRKKPEHPTGDGDEEKGGEETNKDQEEQTNKPAFGMKLFQRKKQEDATGDADEEEENEDRSNKPTFGMNMFQRKRTGSIGDGAEAEGGEEKRRPNFGLNMFKPKAQSDAPEGDAPDGECTRKNPFGRMNMFSKAKITPEEESDGTEEKRSFGRMNMFSKKTEDPTTEDDGGVKDKEDKEQEDSKPSFALRNPFKPKVATTDETNDDAGADGEEPRGETNLVNRMKNPFAGVSLKGLRKEGDASTDASTDTESTASSTNTNTTTTGTLQASMSKMFPKRLTRAGSSPPDGDQPGSPTRQSSFAPLTNALGNLKKKPAYSATEEYVEFDDEAPIMFDETSSAGSPPLSPDKEEDAVAGVSEVAVLETDPVAVFPIRAAPSNEKGGDLLSDDLEEEEAVAGSEETATPTIAPSPSETVASSPVETPESS